VTLLVAALVPDEMILVSDQRLTDASTGGPVTDRANKAIADLRSRSAFAYTGLASVGKKPTDEWIMDSMAEGGGPTNSLELLRDAGTRDFAWLRIAPSIKRLAVIGAGWARFSSGSGDLEPYLVRISNFDGGDRWLGKAQDRFTIRWFHPLRQRGFHPSQTDRAVGAWTAGQDISQERLSRLLRQLRNGLQRTESLAVAARLIAEAVRSFAQGNRLVGKGLVIITIPKPADGQLPGIYAATPPVESRGLAAHFEPSRLPRDSMNFLYVPPDLSAPAASYGPLVIDEGMRWKGVEAWSEKPPWWTD
jgi:hypothetical protein